MVTVSDQNSLWFTEESAQTLEALGVNPRTGLTQQQVEERLLRYGPNKLQGKKKKTILQLVLKQLKDALIYVLLAAVAITFLMGEFIDGFIILIVISINAVLGVVQELKAGNAIEALRNLSAPKALVRRAGVISEIDSDGLVPGDILILDAGRFVAADLRLVESANLQIEESALTGESVPTQKDAAAVLLNPEMPLGDRVNAAFMSTLVTNGRGAGVVVATGMHTEVGKIATIIENEEESKTPLEKRLAELGRTLGKLAAAVCITIFIIAWLQGRDVADMFLTSVSLAVASIPEGLAAIVAIVLSIGVTRMAKQNAIIKKLAAVETLGSVNIVCTDKTGTLTQNKMTVTSYFNLEEGLVELGGSHTEARDDASFLARAMILCSDATYEDEKGTGDPTEIALLLFGDQLNIDRKSLVANNHRLKELAFESDRKLMSTLDEEGGHFVVFVKGAIDTLIPNCTHVQVSGTVMPITEEHRARYKTVTDTMSGQALRTLAAAYKPVDSVIENDDMEKELILIGMVGMIDPPRTEVKESIAEAAGAGIRTIMITGDHKKTAFAIAQDLRIADDPEQAITGEELNQLSDEELVQNIHRFRVFARVSPTHKVKIVRAFKSGGNIVSMTGDGVNDAPSLSTADIGVAMGRTGTDVAKNASDMILADDNFSTIIVAIEQGRNIYNNIKKSVIFLLASNLGEVIAMVVAILAGMPAPLLATQLLWINLVTDTLPAIALGMGPGNPDVMRLKPRPSGESFFAGGAGQRVVVAGTLIGLLTVLGFWLGYYEQGYSPFDPGIPEAVHRYARTMAFMTIITCQLLYAMTFKHPHRSIFRSGLASDKVLVGAIVAGILLQLIVIIIPGVRGAFKLDMLSARGWVSIALIGIIPVIVNEITKCFIRARESDERKHS